MMNIEEIVREWERLEIDSPNDWKLRLRNTILFIKDEHRLTVQQLADNLGVSYRTVYRMLEDSEYAPNLTLKGYLYIQRVIGLDVLERMA